MKYFVEEGCSVTSKRGVLGAHDEVSPADFGHKDDTNLKKLKEKGKLYTGKMSRPEEEKAKFLAEAKKKAAADKKKAAVDKKAENEKKAAADKKAENEKKDDK